jgi:DNA-binding protein Fis
MNPNLNFTDFILKVQLKIIDKSLKVPIKNTITKLFKNLGGKDLNNLYILTSYLINKIKKLFNVVNDQFMQNNNRDLKAIILLLLPFIDDENPMDFNDLNQLLYANVQDNISNKILKFDISDVIGTKFKYGNMALGLLNNYKSDSLLELNQNGTKLINIIIYHNFIALLETLSIINGKLYVNWLNIVPLSFKDYNDSEIYKATKDNIYPFINLEDYNGLYIGDFYNVYRNNFYEEIKKIKWLIFITTYERKQYYIQYLANFSEWLEFNNFNELIPNKQNNFKIKIQSITKEEYIIWKDIIIFMVNNYSNKDKIPQDICKKFILQIDEEGHDDYKDPKFKDIDNKDVYNFLIEIKYELLWNFIRETIYIFQNTFFGFKLIKDKQIISDFDQDFNLKNLYNLAKCLSHKVISTENQEWELLPCKYSGLPENEQTTFWNRFGDIINQLKFNLKREGINESDITGQKIKIANKLDKKENGKMEYKYELVWEYLIYSGLLSKFDYKENLNKYTFKTIVKNNFKKNKKEWLDTHYFLTNNTYNSLNKLRFLTYDGFNELDYFDALEKKHAWYSFYAMDWIAQIGFFHHYLNHRILYITGSTGTGKSTQIPKLMMYALKMIDYKNNGSVVCTQPRLEPTSGNAINIADQLGLPIEQPTYKSKTQIRTRNYQVQFKHAFDTHTKIDCPHLTLSMVTDGTLYTEIKTNSLMKKKSDKIYTFDNIYDIIMVDEAHEHNTNMDLILGLARQTCYYNNSIRFVIISATMNDDDPIYRRFYNCINDNLLYPIKNLYKSPILDRPFLHDSIYLDRRYHISPPGETTQYEIIEYYLPKPIISYSADVNKNSEITQLECYKIIKNICSETPKGDILLFVNGINEIMKAVKYLNNELPEGNIALPYYAELNPLYKNIITTIHLSIGKIKTYRNKVEETWTNIFIEDKSVPDNIYKRAIIIATNVAEASITISSLKFVIDNGYAKVNIYNNSLQISQLLVDLISESSRKQRKGRVGRVGDGVVYYAYEKGSRENIKPKYKIIMDDASNIYTQFLSSEENKLIEDECDPNIYGKYKPQIIQKDTSEINKIFIKQYKYPNKIEYYWNDYYFNFMKDSILPYLVRYEKGYGLNTINDHDGKFYLIHPFENDIKRNIINDIILFKNTKTSIIHEDNYIFLYKLLNQRQIIKNLDTLQIDTNYLTKLNKWKLLYYYDNNESIALLMGKYYNSFDEIFEIIIMLKIIDNNINNLFIKKQDSLESDIYLVYEVINKFKTYFNLPIFTNNRFDYYKNIIDMNFEDIKKKVLTGNYLNIPSDISVEIWNKYNKIDYKDIGDEVILKVQSYYSGMDFTKWCLNNNIKVDNIKNFIYRYIANKLKYIKTKDTEEYDFIPAFSLKEKIMLPFIHGNALNLAIRLKSYDDKYYIHNLSNVVNPSKNINTIIFYYTLTKNLELSIVNTIDIKWLKNLTNIYKNNQVDNIFWKYLYERLANYW